METPTIDKLFLELSLFSNAKTKREIRLEALLIADIITFTSSIGGACGIVTTEQSLQIQDELIKRIRRAFASTNLQVQ